MIHQGTEDTHDVANDNDDATDGDADMSTKGKHSTGTHILINTTADTKRRQPRKGGARAREEDEEDDNA